MRVTLFEYMVVISVSLISRKLLGSPLAKPASGPCSQGRSSAFTEGPAKLETVTRRAAQRKQKSEPAAGRRTGPTREPDAEDGIQTEGTDMRQSHPNDSCDGKLHQPQPSSALKPILGGTVLSARNRVHRVASRKLGLPCWALSETSWAVQLYEPLGRPSE